MEWLMSLWHKRHSLSDPIKEYDRTVDGPEGRKRLEKQRPSLVAARDQAIVELRREKLQKETAEKAHKVARVRSNGSFHLRPAVVAYRGIVGLQE